MLAKGAGDSVGVGLVAMGLLALGLAVAGNAEAESEPLWGQAESTTVVAEADPVDFDIAPDGEVWWNHFARANVIRYDPANDAREIVFDVDPIENPVERGLVGLALAPDFEETGAFYVFYTDAHPNYPKGGTNILSRVEDGEETRLLEIPAFIMHNGGRIEFDGQGRMFVSTGDSGQGHQAQNPSSLFGSVLHLRQDGSPANDTLEGPVYSIGHRNVYGLAYDEENDRLFATENSADEDDEVNRIEPGGNYGWPHCQGERRYDYARGDPLPQPCDEPTYEEPIATFYDNRTAAPTGATMFHGDLYWASWNDGEIHRLTEDPETGAWNDTVVFDAEGRVADLETHNGSLYYSVSSTKIARIDVPLQEPTGSIATEVPTAAGIVDVLVLASVGVLAGRRHG